MAFITDKLRMDGGFVQEELGHVVVKKVRDPRSKFKDEVVVQFETKQVRDAVKAKAVNLANFRDKAGVRLELPDHLQKDFHLLMNLAYDMKQRNRDQRRNIKFDEKDAGLYMDVQVEKDGQWKRIKPVQAKGLAGRRRGGPEAMDEEELKSLVGSDSGDQ